MKIILINLLKQPFIVKIWNFNKNKLYHSLKLKTETFTDTVTISFTAINCKGLKFC